jgi:hypothetical protein
METSNLTYTTTCGPKYNTPFTLPRDPTDVERSVQNCTASVRCEVLMAVSIKISVFSDMTPCSLADRHQRFGRGYNENTSHKLCRLSQLAQQRVPPSRWNLSTRLYGVTSQNTVTWTFEASQFVEHPVPAPRLRMEETKWQHLVNEPAGGVCEVAASKPDIIRLSIPVRSLFGI